MKKTAASYSLQVRERAVRLVLDGAGEHPAQWAAISSVAAKIGCTTETLRNWVRQAERLVTSHLVERSEGLVLVDGQWQPGPAQELGRYIAATGQRFVKALVTHAHPDHWFGFHHLGRPPIHAGPVSARFPPARPGSIRSSASSPT